MALNSRIAFVGVSKQSVKGTPVTPPTYGFGIRGGQVLSTDLDQSADELTSTDRFATVAQRLGVQQALDFTTRVYPASAPLILYGAAGAITTSGAGPYTHTITPASTVPYLTGFGRLDTEYSQVQDCKVDEVSITWDGTAPPEMGVRLMGTVLTYGSTWTATNDESANTFLPTAGGTFQFDADGTTNADADIVGGTITLANNLEPILLSKQIEPDDVWEAVQVMSVSLRMKPTNFDDNWRTFVTGSAAGTTVQTDPVYGAFNIRFAIDANTYINISADRVAYVADYPEGSPAGSPVEITCVGEVLKPSGADAFTIEAKNSTASY